MTFIFYLNFEQLKTKYSKDIEVICFDMFYQICPYLNSGVYDFLNNIQENASEFDSQEDMILFYKRIEKDYKFLIPDTRYQNENVLLAKDIIEYEILKSKFLDSCSVVFNYESQVNEYLESKFDFVCNCVANTFNGILVYEISDDLRLELFIKNNTYNDL